MSREKLKSTDSGFIKNLKLKLCQIMLFLSHSEQQMDLQRWKLYQANGFSVSKCFNEISRGRQETAAINDRTVDSFEIANFIRHS